MKKIDLRSDTITRPTEAMRRAMAEAEVGDDVFGEDPTINKLQEKAAELLGKEAALYAASGTMANQISLRVHTRPGDEIICDRHSHVYRNEGGAAASLSGLSFFLLDGDQGRLTADQVAEAIMPDNIHFPVSKVVSLENTHNRGNGSVYDLDQIAAIADLARKNGLGMHLDGARMFHACLAGGYSPPELAQYFDTISFCLSKGLGAPVGSMIVSTKENIKLALRYRKQYGGGMRQAGILGAAGLYALENNIDRLADDHARAKKLALALADMPKVSINPDDIQTNIVIFDCAPSGLTPVQTMEALAEAGVLVLPFGGTNLRAVLHLEIDDADIDQAVESFGKVFG